MIKNLTCVILLIVVCSCIHRPIKSELNTIYNSNELYEIIDTLSRYGFDKNFIIVFELSKNFKQTPISVDSMGNVVADAPPPPPPGSENYYDRQIFESLLHENLLSLEDAQYMFNQIDSSIQYCIDSVKVKNLVVRDSAITACFRNNKKGNGYDALMKNYKAKGFVRFSTPLISKNRNKVLLSIDFHCGGLCGGGETILFEKKNGIWNIINRNVHWVS